MSENLHKYEDKYALFLAKEHVLHLKHDIFVFWPPEHVVFFQVLCINDKNE